MSDVLVSAMWCLSRGRDLSDTEARALHDEIIRLREERERLLKAVHRCYMVHEDYGSERATAEALRIARGEAT